MLRTCEVRWFFSAVPFERSLIMPEAVAWLPPRTDWYAAPVNPKCGVKVREAALEPKLLLQDDGPRTVGLASGRLQHWAKWSLAFPAGDSPSADLLSATDWIPVEKRRCLRFFRCKNGRMAEVDSADGAHCQLEWTEATIADTKCWTIGLESSAGGDLKQVLLSVAERVLRDVPSEAPLGVEHSYSYPAWLAKSC